MMGASYVVVRWTTSSNPLGAQNSRDWGYYIDKTLSLFLATYINLQRLISRGTSVSSSSPFLAM